jgi:tRNA 5-methylaminomethyl-2-thiouridine biosynthesis bifunctional protein
VAEQRGPGIRPAQIDFRDGALYSTGFGDIYHSVDGALGEVRHVFLYGNDLPRRWGEATHFTIVETGFGCGLNFLATWDAFRQSGVRCRLHFVSVEKHPFSRSDLAQILGSWPQLGDVAHQLVDAYPPLIPGFHRLCLDDGDVCLTLLFGEASAMLGELDARGDAFYLDGFAPARNPDMWSEDLFAQVRRIAAPGATVATYSAASMVRTGLERAGFATRKSRGFGRKRDMLVARLPGESSRRQTGRKAIVIGAGIAGASSAYALARKGVEVELIDREATAGSGSSFNPAAVIRPFLSLDQGIRDRFGIAAFVYAVRLYRELNRRTPCGWSETGVLQLAKDPGHRDKLWRAMAMADHPAELARCVDAQEATALCGVPVNEEGLWFSSGGFVDGRKLCNALIAASSSVNFRGNTEAHSVHAGQGLVRVADAGGRVIASGDVVVLANGIDANRLFPGGAPWLRAIRGQVTAITAAAVLLRAPVCRDGYVTPRLGEHHFVGATFDQSRGIAAVTEDDRIENLQRAARILPGVIDAETAIAQSDWAAVRCASRDRLPVLGRVDENLVCCMAMGSRGFSWAPLAAEAVASFIAGVPAPLERSVAQRLSPARFAMR